MRFLSVKQAADELGVSQGVVYALCSQRRVQHSRVGIGRGRIQISTEDLERYRDSVTLKPIGTGTEGAISVEQRSKPPTKLKHLTVA